MTLLIKFKERIDLTANEEMGTGETITIENSTSTGE